MSATRKDRMIALWAATVAIPTAAIAHEYLSTAQQILVAGACVATLAALMLATAIVARLRGGGRNVRLGRGDERGR